MVLLLEEADDPNAKLALHSGPPVNRISVDDLSEIGSTDSESEETVPLVRQDPPPSYNDVRQFQARLKTEEETYRGKRRARRRFCLALGATILLLSIPTIVAISIKLSLFSKSVAEPSEPSTTTRSASPRPTSDYPNNPPPWREYPGKGPGDHRGGPGGGPGGGDHFPHHGGGGGERRPGDDDRGRGDPHRFPEGEDHGRPEFPPPDPTAQPICADWTSTEISDDEQAIPAFISTFPLWYFNRPVFIRSSIDKAAGNLRVTFEDHLEPGRASIRVTASKLSEEGLEKVQVCINRGFEGSFILELKSSETFTDSTNFDIVVSLSPQQQTLPGLVTDLSRFAQSFDSTGSSRFQFMNLYGQEGDISFEGVSTGSLLVTSSDSSINGYVSANRRLGIETSSKPISITVDLCNDSQDFYPTWARLSSSQASIDAKMVLCERVSDAPWQRKDDVGHYDIHVTNKDAPTALEIKHTAPEQGSSLYINVTNEDTLSLGRTHTTVTLDAGYEGRFSVQAPGSTIPVTVQSDEATDERGGVRYVEKGEGSSGTNGVKGRVYWSRHTLPDYLRSDVFVKTVGEGGTSLVLLGD